MNKTLLALSVLSMSVCSEPASAATPVNCGDNLNAPGQYVLTGDLSCSGTAVTITANDVHFDLAGFTIDGDSTSPGIDVGGLECIDTSGVHISNGTVTGFVNGIFLCDASNARVNGMTVTHNTDFGIFLTSSDNNKLTGNFVTENSIDGIRLDNGSDNNQVIGNTLTDNVTGDGLEVRFSQGNKVTGNDASRNGDDGIDVDNNSDNTRVNGNTANNNGDEGIVLDEGSSNSRVQGNIANGNVSDGIELCGDGADNNTVKGNTTNENEESGIEVSSGAAGNLLTGNTSLNNVFGPDMRDVNIPNCVNTWKGNTFLTDNEGDGSGAGCIQ